MNSKDVLILCSNKKYLEYAKYTFSMFLDKVNWDIDLCLIVDDTVSNDDLKPFIDKNIIIKSVPTQNKPYLIKFFLFHVYFKKWENILYLDTDIFIFNDFKYYIKNYCKNDDNVIYACESLTPLNNQFCFMWDIDKKNKNIKLIENKYEIDLSKKYFNSGIMYFNTKIIDKNTVNNLFKIQNDLILENNHSGKGTDQPIINILFKDKFKFLDKNKFTMGVNFNIKNNNINTDDTLIHHFFGYFAPWKNIIEKYYINYPFFNKYDYYLKKFNI